MYTNTKRALDSHKKRPIFIQRIDTKRVSRLRQCTIYIYIYMYIYIHTKRPIFSQTETCIYIQRSKVTKVSRLCQMSPVFQKILFFWRVYRALLRLIKSFVTKRGPCVVPEEIRYHQVSVSVRVCVCVWRDQKSLATKTRPVLCSKKSGTIRYMCDVTCGVWHVCDMTRHGCVS